MDLEIALQPITFQIHRGDTLHSSTSELLPRLASVTYCLPRCLIDVGWLSDTLDVSHSPPCWMEHSGGTITRVEPSQNKRELSDRANRHRNQQDLTASFNIVEHPEFSRQAKHP